MEIWPPSSPCAGAACGYSLLLTPQPSLETRVSARGYVLETQQPMAHRPLQTVVGSSSSFRNTPSTPTSSRPTPCTPTPLQRSAHAHLEGRRPADRGTGLALRLAQRLGAGLAHQLVVALGRGALARLPVRGTRAK